MTLPTQPALHSSSLKNAPTFSIPVSTGLVYIRRNPPIHSQDLVVRSGHLGTQDRSAGGLARFRESLTADLVADTKDCNCRLSQACPRIHLPVDLDTTTARERMILENTVVPALGGHLCTEAEILDQGSLGLKASRVADPAPLVGSQAEAELENDIARVHDMGSGFAQDAEMAAVALSESPEGVQDMMVVARTSGMQKE